MKNLLAIAMLAFALNVPAAHAQEAAGSATPLSAEREPARLDRLFDALKRARNPQAAERIADRIRREWTGSGSATIDLMMQWAAEAMAARKNGVALDFLDQVTVLAPDYAEGWNRRATLHYVMDQHAKSMADIGRVLRLEPRHFGALAGMAGILRERGSKQQALEAYMRVLEVYPMLRDAQDQVGELADELAGEGI